VNVEQSGAEFVTAIDPSCLMHLKGVFGATRRKLKTIYLAGILASTSTKRSVARAKE
jgi:hypothetical protein